MSLSGLGRLWVMGWRMLRKVCSRASMVLYIARGSHGEDEESYVQLLVFVRS